MELVFGTIEARLYLNYKYHSKNFVKDDVEGLCYYEKTLGFFFLKYKK